MLSWLLYLPGITKIMGDPSAWTLPEHPSRWVPAALDWGLRGGELCAGFPLRDQRAGEQLVGVSSLLRPGWCEPVSAQKIGSPWHWGSQPWAVPGAGSEMGTTLVICRGPSLAVLLGFSLSLAWAVEAQLEPCSVLGGGSAQEIRRSFVWGRAVYKPPVVKKCPT